MHGLDVACRVARFTEDGIGVGARGRRRRGHGRRAQPVGAADADRVRGHGLARHLDDSVSCAHLGVVDQRRALVHHADRDALAARARRPTRLRDEWRTRSRCGRVPPPASSPEGRPAAARSSRPSAVHNAVHVRGSSAAVVIQRPSLHWYRWRAGETGMPYDESVRCPSLPLSSQVVDSARLMSRCAPRPVRSRSNKAAVIPATAMSPPVGHREHHLRVPRQRRVDPRQHPRVRQVGEVVPRPIRVGPVLAVAGDRAPDERRVVLGRARSGRSRARRGSRAGRCRPPRRPTPRDAATHHWRRDGGGRGRSTACPGRCRC